MTIARLALAFVRRSPLTWAFHVLVEALVLGLAGGLLGLALGRLAAVVAARITASGGGPALALPAFGPSDAIVLGGAVLLSLAAALVPAAVAYRLRPAQVLKS